MKSSFARLSIFLCLSLLLGSCASFDAHVDHGRSFKEVQRFFVVSNFNDNHALDRHIAAALQARGREVSVGPLTMMPENTQAVLVYQDYWAWDFGDHLTFLKVSVRDARALQPYATVIFSAKIPLREEAPVTVDRLIETLLKK